MSLKKFLISLVLLVIVGILLTILTLTDNIQYTKHKTICRTL